MSFPPKVSYATDASGNVYGFTSVSSCEYYGASPSASASVNTSAIQTALNKGGIVTLSIPGTYQVNNTLTYKSNTNLILGAGVILQQAASTNLKMLQSQATVDFQAGGTTVTLTYSAATDCTVTWTGHGLVKGQYIWLEGANLSAFRGVFQVYSVTDANNVVIQLRYVPSASPTGTIKGIKATYNFHLEGGTFDYNKEVNGAGAGLNLMCCTFYGVAASTVRKTKAINSSKYGFMSEATNDFTCYDLEVVTENDGYKLLGPAFNTRVLGISGRTHDDGITVQSNAAISYPTYQITAQGGDCLDIKVTDVNIDCDKTAVMVAGVYLTDNEIVDMIEFDGISGYSSSQPVRIEMTAGYSTGVFGSITLKRLNAKGTAQVQLGKCSGKILNIEKPHVDLTAFASGNFIFDNSTTNITQVNITEAELYQTGLPTSAVNLITLVGTYSVINFFGGLIANGGASQLRGLVIGNAANIETVNFFGFRYDSDTLVTIAATPTITPTINFISLIQDGSTSAVAVVNATCNLTFSGGCRFKSVGNGVVRFAATATVNLYSDGTNKLISGNWVQAPLGTPTINLYGMDIAVNVGTAGLGFNKTTKGQFCLNTGANGTLVTNTQVNCDGTNWRQMSNSTLLF